MSQIAEDILALSAKMSGHSPAKPSSLTTRAMLAAYASYCDEKQYAPDEISTKKRFLLYFSTNLIPEETLTDLNTNADLLITQSRALIDKMMLDLEQKVDCVVVQEGKVNTTIAQLQVRSIHQISGGAQRLSDLLTSKVAIFQDSEQIVKSAIEAVNSLSVIWGKILDTREADAYLSDLKMIKGLYSQAAKSVANLIASAQKVQQQAMRRDSAIRMLINQSISTPDGGGIPPNGNYTPDEGPGAYPNNFTPSPYGVNEDSL